MDYAFEFIIKNKGIDTEDDYPYQARDKTCDKNKVISFFTCAVVRLLVFAGQKTFLCLIKYAQNPPCVTLKAKPHCV